MRKASAILTFFLLFGMGCSRSATVQIDNSQTKNQEEEEKAPLIWIGPGWYGGIWFGTEIEFNTWHHRHYYRDHDRHYRDHDHDHEHRRDSPQRREPSGGRDHSRGGGGRR